MEKSGKPQKRFKHQSLEYMNKDIIEVINQNHNIFLSNADHLRERYNKIPNIR